MRSGSLSLSVFEIFASEKFLRNFKMAAKIENFDNFLNCVKPCSITGKKKQNIFNIKEKRTKLILNARLDLLKIPMYVNNNARLCLGDPWAYFLIFNLVIIIWE